MATNDDQVVVGSGFPARVWQSFGKRDAATVLRAYRCTVERSRADAKDRARIADILLGQHADSFVVTAGLLAPLHQRGDLTTREIRSLFGEDMSSLVERASSERVLRTDTEVHRREDLRRWLTSISFHIRTVVLRVALRLGVLEELAEAELENGHNGDQREMARETLELYVPLADRMGMGSLRTRLEDVCLQLLEPSVHAEMARSIGPIQEEDQICLSLLEDGVHRLLTQHSIDAVVQGRTKGLYSVYRKMRRLNKPLDEIMDRIGLRIIVPSVEECYAVLGLLHTHFRPIPGTFDDYIGLPKENGYQSLHTCVFPVPEVSVKPVEFQIRTEEMHREAEHGIAAHWLYKDRGAAESKVQRQLEWLRLLLSQHEEALSHEAFVRHLHQQVYDDRLVVFEETGQPMRLPANTSLHDLGRRLSREPGSNMVLRVNGAVQSRDYKLRDGDSVVLNARAEEAAVHPTGDAPHRGSGLGELTPS